MSSLQCARALRRPCSFLWYTIDQHIRPGKSFFQNSSPQVQHDPHQDATKALLIKHNSDAQDQQGWIAARAGQAITKLLFKLHFYEKNSQSLAALHHAESPRECRNAASLLARMPHLCTSGLTP
jgi:hypothetical protein